MVPPSIIYELNESNKDENEYFDYLSTCKPCQTIISIIFACIPIIYQSFCFWRKKYIPSSLKTYLHIAVMLRFLFILIGNRPQIKPFHGTSLAKHFYHLGNYIDSCSDGRGVQYTDIDDRVFSEGAA